jgi:hypothetical protein
MTSSFRRAARALATFTRLDRLFHLRAQYPTRAPRTRLEVTALEERVVPDGTQVGLEWLSDGGEPGTAAQLRLTRAADANTIANSSLMVTVQLGGTATRGTDYAFAGDPTPPPGGMPGMPGMPGSNTVNVTFAPGQSAYTLDVPVLDDTASEGWESVTALVQSSPNYTVGTTDPVTVWIEDDELWLETDADPVLKGQEVTFWLPDDAPEFATVEWDANYDGTTFAPVADADDTWFATTFTTAGARTVAARVTDANNVAQIVTLSVTVETPPPELTVPEDTTATVGVAKALAVEVDTELDVASVAWAFAYYADDYEWDFETDTTLTDEAVSYTFPSAGEYDVRVTVTDTAGKSTEGYFHVSVASAVPTATAQVSGPISEGGTVTFTVWELDPDALDTITVYANWTGAADAAFQQLNEGDFTTNADGSVSFTHQYLDVPDTGTTFTAKIYVLDEWGLSSINYEVPVTVNNVAPNFTVWAGWKIATAADQGVNLWAIRSGEVLEFRPASAGAAIPNTHEESEYRFHWTVTDASGVPQTFETTAARLALPDYAVGSVYHVEAWVTDGDPVETPTADIVTHTFTVVVEGSRDPIEEISWTGVRPSSIYGQLTLDGTDLLVGYAPYFNTTIRKSNWPTAASATVRFTIDPASEEYALDHGYTIKYHARAYTYDVEQFTIWTDNNDLLSTIYYEPNETGVFVIDAPGALDRRVIVSVWVNFEYNGQVVKRFVDVAGASASTDELAAPRIMLDTPKTQTTGAMVSGLIQLIRDLGPQLAERATALADALTSSSRAARMADVLIEGFKAGVGDFATAMMTGSLKGAVMTWLALDQNLSAYANATWDAATTTRFLLEYSGLTVDKVMTAARQQLGAGNLAALDTVAAWFVGDNGTSPVTDPQVFLDKVIASFDANERAALELDPAALLSGLSTAFQNKVEGALGKLSAQVVAKFVPGAGAVLSVYRAVTWVLENQAQLGNLAQQFLNILDTLTNPLLTRDDGITAVTTAVRTGLDNAVSGLLGMAASQFGLGNLPTEFKRAIQYVPVQVDTIIRAAVARVAVRLGGGASRGLFAGQMAPERTFSHNGIVYVLWVAQDSTGPQVKVARVKAGGGFDYIGTLTAASFTNALREGLDGKNAQEHIDALILAAKALHTATKTAGTSTGALQQKRDAMATSAIPAPGTVSATSSAADKLIADVKNDACKALQAGCFAAGTKLYTRRGWVAVEALVEGDEVAARHESEPGGAVEWKPVEATFRRTGRILHLHFANGELIRTTPEHPFHVEGKGWTAAGALREGDRLETLIGDSVALTEVYDTEEWETVYNVRVADFHTYFVGEEEWGFAVWAHNSYDSLKAALRAAATEANPPAFTSGVPGKTVQTLLDYAKQNTHESWYKFETFLRDKRITNATTIRDLWWTARDQDTALLAQTQAAAQQALAQYVQLVKDALQPFGITDLQFGIRGSLATGYSWDAYQPGTTTGGPGRPWDGKSFDVDAYVKSNSLTAGATRIPPKTGSRFVSLLDIDRVEGFKSGQAGSAAALQVNSAISAAESKLQTVFKNRLKKGSFTFKVFDLGATAVTGLPP